MFRDPQPTDIKTIAPSRLEGKTNVRPKSAPHPHHGPEPAMTPQRLPCSDTQVTKNDEEDFEIFLSPRGSLLAATNDPYDKAERIRTANANLLSEKLTPRANPSKVRFNEKIRLLDIDEETVMEGVTEYLTESVESDCEVMPVTKGKGVHSGSKILLVNVPTGFSEDIEDIASDEGEFSQDTDFRTTTQEGCAEETDCTSFPDEQKEITDEDADDDDDEDDADSEIIKNVQDERNSGDSDIEDVVEDLTENFQTACHVGNSELTEDRVSNVGIEGCNENEDKMNRKTPEIPSEEGRTPPVANFAVVRPKTAQTKRQSSVEPKNNLSGSQSNRNRPSTAPSKRNCLNNWANIKLPLYNGLRSEYGLSAEQLEERRKQKEETIKAFKQQKEQLIQEQKRRQKENELMFATWLVKKKKEAALKAARRRQNSAIFRLKTLPAPTSHLEKMGVVRKKVLARREHTCYSLEEFFRNAKPHEQRTYRIYLGLCTD